jgi:hypothetical protein
MILRVMMMMINCPDSSWLFRRTIYEHYSRERSLRLNSNPKSKMFGMMRLLVCLVLLGPSAVALVAHGGRRAAMPQQKKNDIRNSYSSTRVGRHGSQGRRTVQVELFGAAKIIVVSAPKTRPFSLAVVGSLS